MKNPVPEPNRSAATDDAPPEWLYALGARARWEAMHRDGDPRPSAEAALKWITDTADWPLHRAVVDAIWERRTPTRRAFQQADRALQDHYGRRDQIREMTPSRIGADAYIATGKIDDEPSAVAFYAGVRFALTRVKEILNASAEPPASRGDRTQ